MLDGSLSVSGAVTVGGVLSAAAIDGLDARLDALEADSYISTSALGRGGVVVARFLSP